MSLVITRKISGLRTYYHDDHELAKIVFYRDGEIVLHTRSGWIEREGGVGRPDMPGLTLHNPIRRSIKVNLTRGGHFYISSGKTYYSTRPTIDLYIDLALDDCALGAETESRLYELDSGITYQKVRPLTAVFGTDERQTIEVASGGAYTVANAYGKALAAIEAYLKTAGLERSVTGIETVIKDRRLLDMLLAAHTLVTAPAAAVDG